MRWWGWECNSKQLTFLWLRNSFHPSLVHYYSNIWPTRWSIIVTSQTNSESLLKYSSTIVNLQNWTPQVCHISLNLFFGNIAKFFYTKWTRSAKTNQEKYTLKYTTEIIEKINMKKKHTFFLRGVKNTPISDSRQPAILYSCVLKS